MKSNEKIDWKLDIVSIPTAFFANSWFLFLYSEEEISLKQLPVILTYNVPDTFLEIKM